ncbi:hypothetical protein Pelo_5923 [Pelomyxa schiedti]|nr:hypothetical protein Pelo_5923 [Pelomyxa schiedti]
MGLTSTQICAAVSGSLSAAGAAAVIVMCLLWRSPRLLYWRIVLFMAICDLLVCVSVLWGLDPDRTQRQCNIQGWMNNAFFLATYTWTFMLAVCLERITVANTVPGVLWEIVFHTVAWGLPFILSSIPLIPGINMAYISLNSSWCWLDDALPYTRWILSDAWIWLFVVLIILTYAKILIYVWPRRKARAYVRTISITRNSAVHQVLPPLHQVLLYPPILLLVWVPTFVNDMLAGNVAAHMAALLLPSQGLWNFLVFVLTARLDRGSDVFLPNQASKGVVQAENFSVVTAESDSSAS